MARAKAGRDKKTAGDGLLSLKWTVLLCSAVVLLVLVVIYVFSRGPAITGNIEYDSETALPRGSKLSIQLRDIIYPYNNGRLIAETIIVNPGPTPVSFKLPYDAESIEERDTYRLQVAIYGPDGRLLFANDVTGQGIAQELTRVDLELAAVQRAEIPEETGSPPTGGSDSQQIGTDTDTEQTETDAVSETSTDQTIEQTETDVSQTATAVVNIHYDRDYKLPEETELRVYLRHLGQLGASRNEVIAEKTIANPSRSPTAVSLAYDPEDTPADSLYLISAGIYRSDGKQLMTNSTFGFEMRLKQLTNVDVYLIAIYPDEEKRPEDLDAAVTGSIMYKKPCQLPAGSKLVIQLRDVSLADAPSPLIVETEITDPGSSPVKFELKYDSSDINKRNLYSISGSIRGPGGELLFINDTIYEVITRGNPTKVHLPLIKVKAEC